ncbi:hypothetical protein [Actinacidiphila glaucinigra]|uniref:hypothetical protein n=1 Tax=Actinacidiphila glaucinigra TaxID=235986 RepID=UPI0035DC4F62
MSENEFSFLVWGISIGVAYMLLVQLAARMLQNRRDRELALVTYLRLHPDSTAPQICRGLGWGPGRFYPMAERLTERGAVASRTVAEPQPHQVYTAAGMEGQA